MFGIQLFPKQNRKTNETEYYIWKKLAMRLWKSPEQFDHWMESIPRAPFNSRGLKTPRSAAAWFREYGSWRSFKRLSNDSAQRRGLNEPTGDNKRVLPTGYPPRVESVMPITTSTLKSKERCR